MGSNRSNRSILTPKIGEEKIPSGKISDLFIYEGTNFKLRDKGNRNLLPCCPCLASHSDLIRRPLIYKPALATGLNLNHSVTSLEWH